MKREARGLDELGSNPALDHEFAQQLEHSLTAAEDARAEAAAMARERDALVEALDRAQCELRRRDGEMSALRARALNAEAALSSKEVAGSAQAEELSVAMEELQASTVSLEEANDSLIRLNNELERRVAERTMALAESETRLRAATDAVPHLVWTSQEGGMWTWANRRWVEYTGMSASRSTGLGWLDKVHPDDRDATMAAWRAATTERELRVEHRIRAADGSFRWFATRALPARKAPPIGEDGAPALAAAPDALWYGTSTDVEDARRAELALRESEERFRGFAETSTDVLWIADATGRTLEYLSPAFEQVWGQSRSTVMNDLRRWADLLHPDDRDTVVGVLPRVLRGERADAEYRIRRASDGAVRWIRDTGFPILDGAGGVRRVAGLAQDVTDQREAELQQRLLLNELNHRVKNALAGAQALAAQTARGGASASPGAFLHAFEARLMALARAHDLLTREGWRSAALAVVVRETLAPHNGDVERVAVSGPEVRLVPGAAVALHMAFHELATNAAKHGALSAPDGRVEVRWSIARPPAGADAPPVLDIRWRERGGPPIGGPPARTGFGARLLERGLPQQLGGVARLRFSQGGIEFHLSVPLSPRVQAKEGGAAAAGQSRQASSSAATASAATSAGTRWPPVNSR